MKGVIKCIVHSCHCVVSLNIKAQFLSCGQPLTSLPLTRCPHTQKRGASTICERESDQSPSAKQLSPELSAKVLCDVLRKSWRTPEGLTNTEFLANDFQDSFIFFGGGGFSGIHSSSLRYAFAVLKDQFYMASRPRRAAWCRIALLSLEGEPLLSFPLTSQSQHTTNGLDPKEDGRRFIEWPLCPIIFTTLSIREFKHLTSVSISTCGHPGLHTSL